MHKYILFVTNSKLMVTVYNLFLLDCLKLKIFTLKKKLMSTG